jgi:hypothetical protein
VVRREVDDSVVWSANLEPEAKGTTTLSWGADPDYETSGDNATEVASDQRLYADATGGQGRSLGRWLFTRDQLRPGELLLGYGEPKYMDASDLANEDPVDC